MHCFSFLFKLHLRDSRPAPFDMGIGIGFSLADPFQVVVYEFAQDLLISELSNHK